MDNVLSNAAVLEIWEQLINGVAPNAIKTQKPKDIVLKDIVLHQYNAYPDKITAKKEGFHVGAPFNGFLGEAPLLFVGSNLGFTPSSLAPRLKGKDVNGEVIFEMFDENTGAWVHKGINDVRDFCYNVFQNTHTTNSGNLTVRRLIKGGKLSSKPGGVPYWKGMRDSTEKFFGKEYFDMKYSGRYPNQNKNNAKYTKLIMEKVASTEIVPFGSQDESVLDNNLLTHCWSEFTEKIIAESDAKLVILVGSKAKDTFIQLASPTNGMSKANAKYTLEAGDFVKFDFNGVKKLVISVGHFSSNCYNCEYRKKCAPDSLSDPQKLTALKKEVGPLP
jgi:hypothetical protein